MPKKATELSDIQVRRLAKVAGFHAVGGVAGLYLNAKPPAASWILKRLIGRHRREMGLGGYPEVTLSAARDKARQYVELIAQGRDPVTEKHALKSALLAAQAMAETFRQVAGRYVAKKSREFKTAKQAQKLVTQLENYAYPHVGNMLVADIERAHIVKMLEPIWETKTETATRIRAHVERILDMAGAEGLRGGDNPARWAGNLALSFPLPGKVTKVTHLAALEYRLMPDFMVKLENHTGMGAACLRFIIATAARSGEARNAAWDEIDIDAAVWTVPAARMKGGRAHSVPLTRAAIKLLEALPRADSGFIFHNTKGGPITDVYISKIPKILGHDVTAHGFRSAFRTWAQEQTSYADEVCELALAHVNSDKTRAAYARSELIDKRRKLMNDWERFYSNGQPAGKVVALRAPKA